MMIADLPQRDLPAPQPIELMAQMPVASGDGRTASFVDAQQMLQAQGDSSEVEQARRTPRGSQTTYANYAFNKTKDRNGRFNFEKLYFDESDKVRAREQFTVNNIEEQCYDPKNIFFMTEYDENEKISHTVDFVVSEYGNREKSLNEAFFKDGKLASAIMTYPEDGYRLELIADGQTQPEDKLGRVYESGYFRLFKGDDQVAQGQAIVEVSGWGGLDEAEVLSMSGYAPSANDGARIDYDLKLEGRGKFGINSFSLSRNNEGFVTVRDAFHTGTQNTGVMTPMGVHKQMRVMNMAPGKVADELTWSRREGWDGQEDYAFLVAAGVISVDGRDHYVVPERGVGVRWENINEGPSRSELVKESEYREFEAHLAEIRKQQALAAEAAANAKLTEVDRKLAEAERQKRLASMQVQECFTPTPADGPR